MCNGLLMDVAPGLAIFSMAIPIVLVVIVLAAVIAAVVGITRSLNRRDDRRGMPGDSRPEPPGETDESPDDRPPIPPQPRS